MRVKPSCVSINQGNLHLAPAWAARSWHICSYFYLAALVIRLETISEHIVHINGLVQERCNSSVLAMELRLSCINPSILGYANVCLSVCASV